MNFVHLFLAMCLGISSDPIASQEIDVSEVPKSVLAAADKVISGAEWSSAIRKRKDDKTVYILLGADGDDHDVDAYVTADGWVHTVVTVLSASEVPSVVLDAVKAEQPRFRVEVMTRVCYMEKDDGGKQSFYGFKGRLDGEEVEVSINPDGSKVEVHREPSEPPYSSRS